MTDVVAIKAYSKAKANILSTICLLSCVIMNGSVIIGAVIEIGHILSVYFGVDVFVFKLIIIGAYRMLSAIIVEPEKLKPYAFVSSGVVMAISRTS